MSASFHEFVNENALRKHPFSHDATMRASNGVVVPNDFVVAASVSIPPEAAGSVFVSQIRILPSSCRVVFSSVVSNQTVKVGTASFNPSTHRENTSYGISDDSGENRGIVTFGKSSSLLGLFSGDLQFSSLALPVEISCQRVVREGVSSIRAIQGGVASAPARGAVVLSPGQNVRLVRITDQNTGLPAIRIDAISGEGLNVGGVSYVRSINGQSPDSSGNIELMGGQCVNVDTLEPGRIRISNPCASSCCDCDIYEQLTQSLQDLKQSMDRIRDQYLVLQEQYQKNLAAQAAQMQA